MHIFHAGQYMCIWDLQQLMETRLRPELWKVEPMRKNG